MPDEAQQPDDAAAGSATATEEARRQLLEHEWPATLVLATERSGRFVAQVNSIGCVRFKAAICESAKWARLIEPELPDDFREMPDSIEVRVALFQWVAELTPE